MKKRLFAFLIACMMILSTAVCVFASDTNTSADTFGGYDMASFQSDAENFMSQTLTYTNEDMVEAVAYFESAGMSMYADFYTDYMAVSDSLGAWKSFGTFTYELEEDVLHTVLPVVFENGTYDLGVDFILVDGAPSVSVITFQEQAGLGSSFAAKMKTAAMNTLIGMGTVFVILIFISGVISLFKFIGGGQKAAPVKETTQAVSTASAADGQVSDEVMAVISAAVQAAQEEELVAVIAAAIAAETGMSTDQFVVRSIRRRK